MKQFRESEGLPPAGEGTTIVLKISLDKAGMDELELWCMKTWGEHLIPLLEKKVNGWVMSQARYIGSPRDDKNEQSLAG